VTGVAVIGCGLIGRKRVAALPEVAHLVCVYDTDREQSAALAATVPGCDVAASAEDACARSDVDLVIVATPHRMLAPLACVALDAGRHVLVEKPGAIDVAGARDVAARARANGRTATVGFNHRFHPSFLEAKRVVESGAFGRIMYVRARYGHGGRVGYEREWRASREVSGGGELIDQGIHLVDLTRFLAGDVHLEFGELRTAFWDMEVEDNAFLALRSRDDAFAWLHASWTEWKNLFSFEVMLERAKIDVSGLGGSYGPETYTLFEMLPEMGPPLVHRTEWEHADESWRLELEACLGTVSGAPSIGASIDDAVAALEIVDAAYRKGRP
jgi:predicted dehydrogenase